ncbi:hypothetical protein DFJ74DRAFT_775781, partial [Hyaloraphidium curvatum]
MLAIRTGIVPTVRRAHSPPGSQLSLIRQCMTPRRTRKSLSPVNCARLCQFRSLASVWGPTNGHMTWPMQGIWFRTAGGPLSDGVIPAHRNGARVQLRDDAARAPRHGLAVAGRRGRAAAWGARRGDAGGDNRARGSPGSRTPRVARRTRIAHFEQSGPAGLGDAGGRRGGVPRVAAVGDRAAVRVLPAAALKARLAGRILGISVPFGRRRALGQPAARRPAAAARRATGRAVPAAPRALVASRPPAENPRPLAALARFGSRLAPLGPALPAGLGPGHRERLPPHGRRLPGRPAHPLAASAPPRPTGKLRRGPPLHRRLFPLPAPHHRPPPRPSGRVRQRPRDGPRPPALLAAPPALAPPRSRAVARDSRKIAVAPAAHPGIAGHGQAQGARRGPARLVPPRPPFHERTGPPPRRARVLRGRHRRPPPRRRPGAGEAGDRGRARADHPAPAACGTGTTTCGRRAARCRSRRRRTAAAAPRRRTGAAGAGTALPLGPAVPSPVLDPPPRGGARAASRSAPPRAAAARRAGRQGVRGGGGRGVRGGGKVPEAEDGGRARMRGRGEGGGGGRVPGAGEGVRWGDQAGGRAAGVGRFRERGGEVEPLL